jgi:hypothetical protein
MKTVALLMLVLLAVLSAGAQPYLTGAPPYLNCHLVPGWEQAGPARNYTADNLYEYKDGAAEGYLVFGFVDCKSGGTTITIDVSEMADADAAWGMFASNRDPQAPPLTAGLAKFVLTAQALAQSAMFAKGRYFVEIVQTDGNPSDKATADLWGFAGSIAASLEGRGTEPEAVKWFPAERLVGVKLVPESVLGVRVLKRGFVAKYDAGQAFVVAEDSPQAAAETMKKLRERFAGVTDAKLADDAFAGKVQYLEGICVFRKGRFVAGYANLPDAEEAARRAGTLVARIP